MPLRETDAPLGAPWARPMRGAVDRFAVASELLEDNPLGDPAVRPLWVYRPPGVERHFDLALPSVYVIQGYTGQVEAWAARPPFEPTFLERLDELFVTGDCPPAIVVLVDAWTKYGGSQFLDSPSTGRYLSYLCDEVVAFVDHNYPTAADRDHRAITGKSSGGYGAMVLPMLRPDVFGALASHAGDALFECSMLPTVPKVVRALRDRFDGSWDVFWERLWAADHVTFEDFPGLDLYGYGAAYTPDPARPGKALMPFDATSGRLVPDVWEGWLAHDPVRMAAGHADALRSLRRIHLEAGRSDEFALDLGAVAFGRELDALGVEHTLELFEGTHAGLTYRYPGAIRELVLALSR